jgi:hypothetical protein
MTTARSVLVFLVAASFLAAVGCRSHREASPPDRARSTEADKVLLSPSGAQALRICVDRWNQANMIGWGPALVRISVRRLDATELAAVGLRNSERPRCVASFALESRADPETGCSADIAVPGKPGWCADRSGTFNCAINPFGAYNCPLIHEPLGPPLRGKNATTDERGVLTLDARLKGTRATPPLGWQRYPHRDGFIEPWTGAGKLRPGLSFAGSAHGPCGGGIEETFGKSGVRCIAPAGARFAPEGAIFGPCYPSRRDFRPGDVAACSNGPGDTSFRRWTISGR